MKCPNCNHPRVTLMDGRTTCTWHEDWRAEAEARHVCKIPTVEQRRKYLMGVRQRRGEEAYVKLRDLIASLWERGIRPAGGGV